MQQANQLANLYLLVQVIDAGGLSAAARELGLTRSMVSRRLMALERELGVRLLYRDARNLTVTPDGEKVYRHAVAMCDAAHAAAAAARDARGHDGVQIRIGMDPSLSPLLADMLPTFCAQHPGIKLSTAAADVDALTKQRVDLLLHAGGAPDSTAVVARPVARLRWIVVASPALLEQLEHPRHPDQLNDQDCLTYGADDWNLRGTPKRQRQPRLVSSHLPEVLAMVRAGLGFVQLPMYACHEQLASGELCPALEAFEARPLVLHALTAVDPAPARVVLDFIDFMKSRLATQMDRGVLGMV